MALARRSRARRHLAASGARETGRDGGSARDRARAVRLDSRHASVPQVRSGGGGEGALLLRLRRALRDGPPQAATARKVVTVMFADVSGFTALAERHDPESLQQVMSRYFNEMRGVVELHGGIVDKVIGDAMMVLFGVPAAHEDDAMRAARCSLEMRVALDTLNEEIDARWASACASTPGSTPARWWSGRGLTASR